MVILMPQKTQDIKEDDYYSSKVWETFNGNL